MQPAMRIMSRLWPAPQLLPAQMDLWLRCIPDPTHAVSDGKQSLRPEKFAEMVKQVGQIAQIMGRRLATVERSTSEV